MILELSGFHPIWFANGLRYGRSLVEAGGNPSRDPFNLKQPAAPHQENHAAKRALHGERSHQRPITQHSTARDLRRGIGRAAAPGSAHHERLAAQAPPRLSGGSVGFQALPKVLLVRSERRVPTQSTRAQSKIHHKSTLMSRRGDP